MHAAACTLFASLSFSLLIAGCSLYSSPTSEISVNILTTLRDVKNDCFSRCSTGARELCSSSKDFWIGAVSGGIASFLVFPIDLAKTRIQDQVIQVGTKAAYRNTFQTITKVARKEGLRSIYHGVAPVIIGSAPSSALQLSGNGHAREFLAFRLGVEPASLPLQMEVLAGGFGGLCQVIANSPMESIKVIKQVQGRAAGSTRTIVPNIGLAGLYQVPLLRLATKESRSHPSMRATTHSSNQKYADAAHQHMQ